MAVFDTYLKRKRRREGKVPDVLSPVVPQPLREQLWHILVAFQARGLVHIGHDARDSSRLLEELYLALVRELARPALVPTGRAAFLHHARIQDLLDFTRSSETPDDEFVTMVEMLCWLFDRCGLSDDIEEINTRFREAGCGYDFNGGQIIELTSQHLHTEAVQPALEILADKAFAGANAEYRQAHEHYRAGEFGDVLHECAKAFESTMKIICDQKGWGYSPKATAQALIKVMLDNGFLPPFMEAKLSNFRALLESAIPTPRNKLDGHGAGAKPHDVPQWMAKYMLHLTATTIVMLVDAAEGK